MNHTLHFVIAILVIVLLDRTIPTLAIVMVLWLASWIFTAMRRPYKPRYCMACGTPEVTPIPPDDAA